MIKLALKLALPANGLVRVTTCPSSSICDPSVTRITASTLYNLVQCPKRVERDWFGVEARKRINGWKNDVKHMNDGSSLTIISDPAYTAEYHIEQALINFYRLGLPKSAAVWRFEDDRNRKFEASPLVSFPEFSVLSEELSGGVDESV